MTARAAEIRTELDKQRSALLATLLPLTDAQWASICPAEDWPVGYVAHHIGQGFIRPAGWITQALAGDDPFEFDWPSTHELNARRSKRLGLSPRDETLSFLRMAGTHFSELVGSLSDRQLDLTGFVQGASTRSIEWVTKVVIRHVREHHRGICMALGRPSPLGSTQ